MKTLLALAIVLVRPHLAAGWVLVPIAVRGPSKLGALPSDSSPSRSAATDVLPETRRPPLELPLDTAAEDLHTLLRAGDRRSVEVEGYVTAKRGLGRSLCFLDVTDALHHEVPVQVMLRREELSFRSDSKSDGSFDGTVRCMVPGARVRVTGVPSPSRNPDEALLLARDVMLLGMPRDPQQIAVVLRTVRDGLIPIEEVARATTTASWSVSDLREALLDDGVGGGGGGDERSASSSLRRLADAVLASMPPPGDDYPHEILRRRHDRGEYTLPRPGEEIRLPPREIVQFLESNDDHNATHDISRRCTVRDFIVDAIGPGRNDLATTAAPGMVTVHGWVQNRRRFLGNVTLLELVDEYTAAAAASDDDDDVHEDASNHSDLWDRRLKCVLHPDCTHAERDGAINCGSLGRLLAPGSRVGLTGYHSFPIEDAAGSTTGRGHPVFWIVRATLLRASWRPTVVRQLIESVVDGELSTREAAVALDLGDSSEVEEILEMTDLTARQWRAAEISADLQSSHSRITTVTPAMMEVLDKFEGLRERFPVQRVGSSDVPPSTKEGSREGSRWKRKKEPQLLWMTQRVREAVRDHPDHGKRLLRILDVGGGQGHLANHLATVLGEEVTIQVIDVARGVTRHGAMRSRRRRLPVRYTVGDASEANFRGEVDLVVALHACGALTDVAMGHAAANNAGFVICPCCFRSNPLLKVASYSAAAGELKMSVEEWLAVDPVQYDSLKFLAEVQGDIALANAATHSICALRASALESRTRGRVKVSIKAFPVAFSSRNFCLVGSPRR